MESLIQKISKKRKSQMEIMGLLIIVILFSLGLLFTIRFMAGQKASTVHQSFSTTELAANTMNAFLKTTAKDCRGADMSDLFRDCGGYPSIDCNDDGNIRSFRIDDSINSPFAPDSCVVLKKSVEAIFNDTLVIWQKKYLLQAYIVEGDDLPGTPIMSSRPCLPGDVGDEKPFPITTDRGDLTVSLKICT